MVDAEASSSDVLDAGLEIEAEVGQGKGGKGKSCKEEDKLVAGVHFLSPCDSECRVCLGKATGEDSQHEIEIDLSPAHRRQLQHYLF